MFSRKTAKGGDFLNNVKKITPQAVKYIGLYNQNMNLSILVTNVE